MSATTNLRAKTKNVVSQNTAVANFDLK